MKQKRQARLIAPFGLILGFGCFVLSGCHTDMWRQPRASTQGPFPTEVFADGMADRPQVEGTVSRDPLKFDELHYQGRENRKLSKKLPPTLVVDGETLSTTDPANVEKIIRRGQERFNIFCRHCHGALGDGKGMIAQRGLALRRQPGNYHTDRLRKMPIGHFFDVITNGYGAMFAYGARVDVDDRWAVATYVRALQLSQHAPMANLPQEDYEEVMAVSTAAQDQGGHE